MNSVYLQVLDGKEMEMTELFYPGRQENSKLPSNRDLYLPARKRDFQDGIMYQCVNVMVTKRVFVIAPAYCSIPVFFVNIIVRLFGLWVCH